jgi:hypothetical protein
MATEANRIEPVLTAEEWAEVKRLDCRAHFQATTDLPPRLREMALASDQGRAMAVANSQLPDDDPRKITHEDVEVVQQMADDTFDAADSMDTSPNTTHFTLRRLAEKLRALLPPE